MNVQEILTTLLTAIIYLTSTLFIWQFVLEASVEFSKVGERIIANPTKTVALAPVTPLVEINVEQSIDAADSETKGQALLQQDETVTTTAKKKLTKASRKLDKQGSTETKPKMTVASLRKQCQENGIKWRNAVLDQTTGKLRSMLKEEMETALAKIA